MISVRNLLIALAWLLALIPVGQANDSILGWGAATLVGPQAVDDVTKVSGGYNHSLALSADGTVSAWGGNRNSSDYRGQSQVPFPHETFVDIAAGRYSSQALRSDGTIVAWGIAPLPDPNVDFVEIDAQWTHYLGLKSDGSVAAWGSNTYGQCNVPSPNADFVEIKVGVYHSVGRRSNGTVVAWGRNNSQQCIVPAFNDYIEIAAGFEHSLGLRSDGSIVAWGTNAAGECDIPEPNADFVAIAASGRHNVALKLDGSVVAWGDNGYGECDVPEPNGDFVAIAAGFYHSIAVSADGRVVAWGLDDEFQCAIPAYDVDVIACASSPGHTLALADDGTIWAAGEDASGECSVVEPNTGYVAVAAGISWTPNGIWPESHNHSLGLRADGSIEAWGANHYGQCDVPDPNSEFVAIAAGNRFGLGLKSDGSIVGWGQAPTVPAPNSDFVAIDAGGWLYGFSGIASHALGLKADGSIVAFGSNGEGQCNVPSPNVGFVAVAAGDLHSLGLKADGSVIAWGNNNQGQCEVPEPNTDFVAISAGRNCSFGVKIDGTVVGWGEAAEGVVELPEPNGGFVAVNAPYAARAVGLRTSTSGTLVIEPLPAEIAAPWRLRGPHGWHFQGVGTRILHDMPTGAYELTWLPCFGWTEPQPATVNQILQNGQTLTFSGTYSYVGATVQKAKLLITEVCVSGNDQEFIEIANPGPWDVDLSDYYLTDAVHAPADIYYWRISDDGVPMRETIGGGDYGDFHARFPDDFVIAAGDTVVISVAGSHQFHSVFGFYPHLELHGTGPAPQMRPVFGQFGGVNSIVDQTVPTLGNTTESLVLYYWDGQSDLVTDIDVFFWGTGVYTRFCKTGWVIGDEMYQSETPVADQQPCLPMPGFSESYQRLDLQEQGQPGPPGNGIDSRDEVGEPLDANFVCAPWDPARPSTGTAVEEVPAGRLSLVTITGVSPNPFNPNVRITFDVARKISVALSIHDVRGRVVLKRALGDCEAGRHEVNWDGRGFRGEAIASGVYLVRLNGGGESFATARVVLAK